MKSKELCEVKCCRSNGIRYIGTKWVCNKHYWTLKYGEPEPVADYYKGKYKVNRKKASNKYYWKNREKLLEKAKEKNRKEREAYKHG